MRVLSEKGTSETEELQWPSQSQPQTSESAWVSLSSPSFTKIFGEERRRERERGTLGFGGFISFISDLFVIFVIFFEGFFRLSLAPFG